MHHCLDGQSSDLTHVVSIRHASTMIAHSKQIVESVLSLRAMFAGIWLVILHDTLAVVLVGFFNSIRGEKASNVESEQWKLHWIDQFGIGQFRLTKTLQMDDQHGWDGGDLQVLHCAILFPPTMCAHPRIILDEQTAMSFPVGIQVTLLDVRSSNFRIGWTRKSNLPGRWRTKWADATPLVLEQPIDECPVSHLTSPIWRWTGSDISPANWRRLECEKARVRVHRRCREFPRSSPDRVAIEHHGGWCTLV